MDFSVQIDGLDSIATATAAVRTQTAQELNKALFACGKKVETDAKVSITSGQKTGRIYESGGRIIGRRVRFKDGSVIRGKAIRTRKSYHQASAPGEAPASDTGRLVNSINVDSNISFENGIASIGVGAGRGAVKYAKWLEFGTRGVIGHAIAFVGGKAYEAGEIQRGVAARPFLFPALEKNKAWIKDRLASAIKIALSQAGK